MVGVAVAEAVIVRVMDAVAVTLVAMLGDGELVGGMMYVQQAAFLLTHGSSFRGKPDLKCAQSSLSPAN